MKNLTFLFFIHSNISIGAAVTTSTLTDGILCNSSATFQTPFASLGLVPEGCSSHLFPKMFGDELSHKMLEEGHKMSASEALSTGMVSKVVNSEYSQDSTEEDAALVSEAEGYAREYLQQNGESRRWTAEEIEHLKQVNRQESVALANAFMSEKFFKAMEMNAERRGNSKAKITFQALRLSRPVWSILL